MAFKVLLGLLAAVAVTGGAVYYGTDSGCAGTCPLTAAGPSAGETTSCYSPEDLAEINSSCCSGKSKAKAACCAEGTEGPAAGGDAVAALTGGVALGR